MNTNRAVEIEQALKELSVNELEAVLDALTLVAGQYVDSYQEVDRGLYLVPPYGELIASGDMKCFAKPYCQNYSGRWVLVSGKKAYGVISVGESISVSPGEFDDLFGDQHCIDRKSRLQWWPEKETLYLYPIEHVLAYDVPRDVTTPPGVKTVISDVKEIFEESVSTNIDTDDGDRLIIKVAHSDEQAKKGFSGRTSISSNEGLLIPMYPGRGIWMKDTFVPLKVAFLDDDYKVLSISNLIPNDSTIRLGPDNTAWALEASPAWFDSADIQLGDQLSGINLEN